MTFGKINIEKSLVARRDTAESKTDDRGQLTILISHSLERSLAKLVYDSWQCHRERYLNNRNNIIQQHLRSHNATSAEED